MNRTINRATAALLEAGQITSVSLMANQTATAEGAEIVRQHPGLTTYLHLNLTEGAPLTPPTQTDVSPDVSSPGGAMFRGLAPMLMGLLKGTVRAGDVEAELHAQLDHLADLGISVSGIDSHHHVDAFTPVGDVVERVAASRRLQVRRYRLMGAYTLWGRAKLAMFMFTARATAWRSTRSAALGPGWAGGTSDSSPGPGENFAVASWERLGPSAIQGTEAIVCHPGNSCDARTPLPFAALRSGQRRGHAG